MDKRIVRSFILNPGDLVLNDLSDESYLVLESLIGQCRVLFIESGDVLLLPKARLSNDLHTSTKIVKLSDKAIGKLLVLRGIL